jgi:hypothetical protein
MIGTPQPLLYPNTLGKNVLSLNPPSLSHSPPINHTFCHQANPPKNSNHTFVHIMLLPSSSSSSLSLPHVDFVVFHNITCYTISLLSHIHVNTKELLNITHARWLPQARDIREAKVRKPENMRKRT